MKQAVAVRRSRCRVGPLPLAAILLSPASTRVPITFVVVLLASVLTGAVSAHLGTVGVTRAVVRLAAGVLSPRLSRSASANWWASP